MAELPKSVDEFLRGKRIAVAGVSRRPGQAANAVFRKLRAGGYDVLPVNPNAGQVEGATCYPNLGAIPGSIDGVIVATRPEAAIELARQCGERGIRRVWFHRSFGAGSVSEAAVQECRSRGIDCISAAAH
jgi:hypothetical protein